MPFKKLDVKSVIDEKFKDAEFKDHFEDVEKEYALIRQVVEARKNSGLTQKNLAKIVGVSQQEISRFEKEKHMPKLSNFIKILDAVGLNIKLEEKQSIH
jgi:predicted transcriptional regulator